MPVIVSITGLFGAGKSQLAKLTAAQLGEDVASRVPADYFLVPRPAALPMSDFLRQPLVWDWPLLDTLLGLPIGTEVTTPDIDFTTFTRRAVKGGLSFTIRPVMIVDARAPHPRTDLLVRLDASVATRRQRLAERDLRWGTTVLDNWENLKSAEQTATGRQIRPPDLILDGEGPLADNATRLADLVRESFSEAQEAR